MINKNKIKKILKGGEAHKGMITAVENLYKAEEKTILELLKNNKGYKFVVTG
jgi:hypothetical protein